MRTYSTKYFPQCSALPSIPNIMSDLENKSAVIFNIFYESLYDQTASQRFFFSPLLSSPISDPSHGISLRPVKTNTITHKLLTKSLSISCTHLPYLISSLLPHLLLGINIYVWKFCVVSFCLLTIMSCEQTLKHLLLHNACSFTYYLINKQYTVYTVHYSVNSKLVFHSVHGHILCCRL